MKVIAWETTRHCHLRCRHCRGSADSRHAENELSTEEGLTLIRRIAEGFEHPMLILTGGEPMSRSDIFVLARSAVEQGIRTVMSPCGPMITDESAPKILESGISRISVSLDGADAQTHDDFRGIPGIFEKTLAGIRCAHRHGLSFQINCTVSKLNAVQIPAVLALAVSLGADALDLFFLVPTGRGRDLRTLALSADEHEKTLIQVAQIGEHSPIPIRVTCAPHMVRVRDELGMLPPPPHGGSQGCLAGKRFLFVSHTGEVQPCGFLQTPCGNLRDFDFNLRRIDDESLVLNALRNPDGYEGSCGKCGFRHRCGGCRARAFEETGNYLAGEPFCKLYRTLG